MIGECPEHGERCGGEDCCCVDKHIFEPRPAEPEMVAVARIWAQERIDQFRDERDSIKNWAYRMYRDLHEIVTFETIGGSDPGCVACGYDKSAHPVRLHGERPHDFMSNIRAVTEDDNHEHVANGHGCCRVCGRRVECQRCRNPYDEDVDAWGICRECWSHE